jgi:uroporphyrin-III C-methyltransferase/precorrin-2 dehydrogenase/sirohydrochlorin ferrochelatase
MTPLCSGHVSLVGAGPGDPALLTRAALARLRRADLVLFDALVPPAIVRLARRARRFPVGKRAGRPSMRQETIHTLMIRAARRGQAVVRLKGGDPFVFGRGGEEALALRAAGVPFDVIPGISSALAGPALSGIPVTHRGTASAFTVVGGHAPSSYEPVLDAVRPQCMTLVFLMAVASQREIADALLIRGWPSGTPAALIFDASRADGYTWTGTVAALARNKGPRKRDAAGLLVVGDVVNLRADILSLQTGDAAVAAAAGSER